MAGAAVDRLQRRRRVKIRRSGGGAEQREHQGSIVSQLIFHSCHPTVLGDAAIILCTIHTPRTDNLADVRKREVRRVEAKVVDGHVRRCLRPINNQRGVCESRVSRQKNRCLQTQGSSISKNVYSSVSEDASGKGVPSNDKCTYEARSLHRRTGSAGGKPCAHRGVSCRFVPCRHHSRRSAFCPC